MRAMRGGRVRRPLGEAGEGPRFGPDITAMIRRLLAAPLALVLASPLLAQKSDGDVAGIPAAREFAHHETIWTAYHAASGYGDVELRPMLLDDQPELRLTAMFVFRGERLVAPPPMVSVAFVARGPSARFAGSRAVQLLPEGGAPLVVDTKATAHTVRELSPGVVEERIGFRVPTPEFLRLSNARRLRARVGSAEVTFGDEQLEALRDFASRMRPAVFDSTRAAATARVATRGFAIRKAVYEPRDVDEPARAELMIPRPAYPTTVPAAQRVSRRVLLEFVVDSTGRVDLESMRGQSPEWDTPFVAALRASYADARFTPAKKHGRPVAQIVRQAIPFEP